MMEAFRLDRAIGDRHYLTTNQLVHAFDGYDPENRCAFSIHQMITRPGAWVQDVRPTDQPCAKITLNNGQTRMLFVTDTTAHLSKGLADAPCEIVVQDMVFKRDGSRMEDVWIKAQFSSNLWDAMIETLRLIATVHSPKDKWLSISYSGKQIALQKAVINGEITMKFHREFRNIFYHKVYLDGLEIGMSGGCAIKSLET